jgi:hypothetical protein
MRIPYPMPTLRALRPASSLYGLWAMLPAGVPACNDTREDMTGEEGQTALWAWAIQRAQEIIRDVPEIREDRVRAARRALVQGTLNLNEAVLATKLLQQTVLHVGAWPRP